jgi:DNA-binding GntR family transcriptional regulator
MEKSLSTGEALQRLDQVPPLRHQVHQQLEALIASGTLAPGVRLVEGDLAQTLGVSRGPIREALQLLARDGYIDLRPRQGAFVHVPTMKEIQDFFDIRRALETESARLAALRVTPEIGERLKGVLKDATVRLDRGEDPSAVNQRVPLHEEITRAADNPLLAQMLADLKKRSSWYLKPFEPQQRRRSWDEHGIIVAAILRGDSDKAREAMAHHIEGARDSFTEARRDSVGS